uniref:MOG interacting and ectopic P-granules protein 1 n=1 Tax=Rhipicephalus pulchellus TaxID=72859 RepID=L7M3L2_RHIPC
MVSTKGENTNESMPGSTVHLPGESKHKSTENMEDTTVNAKTEEDDSLASRQDDSNDKDSTSSEPGRNGVAEDSSMPAKESQNSADVKPSKETLEQPVDEESEEEGGDEEEKVQPGLPKFLRRYVKIGKYVPVSMPKSGDFRMEELEALLEAPSLVTPLLIKKPDQFFTENGAAREKKPEKKRVSPLGKGGNSVSDFFQSTAGEFLIGLGLSRALEVFNRDLIRLKEREMKKAGGRTQEMIEEHRRLTEAHQQAKIANAPYTFKVKPCRVCDFKTESSLVLEGHLLTPHFTSRRELQCSFCNFVTRDAKAIVFHMEAIHNKLPTMEPPPQFYECPFCPFETNLKTKASGHVNRCQKYFNNGMNQLPSGDFQPPGVTAKPITIEDIKTYEKFFLALGTNAAAPAKGGQNRTYTALSRNGAPALAGPRGAAPPLYQQLASTASLNQNRGRGRPRLALIQPAPVSNQVFQVVGSGSEVIPLLNGSPQLTVTLARAPTPANNGNTRPGPRAAAPLQAQQQTPPGQRPRTPVILESSGSGAAFVICEICDGYIKDLEQLRTHMQWIHKVKIHPKMLASRPPLNCQKCQWRFFTDQGLERHLLGAHGLVTSNMQDLANSGQDGGRCTVCGRIYASKLVAHMSQVHRVVLKPAHLSYKCTVCTATFNLYKLFETHVYTVHSGAMKRSSAAASDDRPAKRPAVAPPSVPAAPAKAATVSTKAEAKPEPKETANVPAKPAPKPPTSASSKVEEAAPTKVATPVTSVEPAEPLMGNRCATCKENVEDLAEHLKEKHIRRCHVRVCHIEKCDRCLCSFDGMIVLHTSDFGDEDSSEDDEEEDEEDAARQEPMDVDGPRCPKDAGGQDLKKADVDDQQADGE